MIERGIDALQNNGHGPAPGTPTIGVLALQGDFRAHRRSLERAGAAVREVRRPDQLDGLQGLILPGGESTALLRLLARDRMDLALVEFHERGGMILGTCAGVILLAREVCSPAQPGLGLLDVTVDRNAFGRQIDSFVGTGAFRFGEGPEVESEMVFIRAPRIRRVGPGVETLASWEGEPVLVRQGRILGATFHPEMSPGSPLPAWFVQEVTGAGPILRPRGAPALGEAIALPENETRAPLHP